MGVYFQIFIIFLISFEEILKLNDLKSEKLKASFYKLLSFSFLNYLTFESLKN
jgi:hypothetical protein